MAIVKVLRDVNLLRENGDVPIVMVCKFAGLLRERGTWQ